MLYCSEIFITQKSISKTVWQGLVDEISQLANNFKTWRIIIDCRKAKIHYYVETPFQLPPSLHNLPEFLFKTSAPPNILSSFPKPFLCSTTSNFLEFKTYFAVHQNQTINYYEFYFQKICRQNINKVYVHSDSATYQLFPTCPTTLLATNYESIRHFIPQSPPKYLDSYKALSSLQKEATNCILEVETFPYHQTSDFLNLTAIDFAKHSVIFGASGCGKSQFISLLIQNVFNSNLATKYKFVIIDPHAALENEIGGLGAVIDFLNSESSINLFANSTNEVMVSVELLLDVLKGLIANHYNSKLERVLRHSLHLLLTAKKFNFHNLRNLLLDLEFRSQLLQEQRASLPHSVIEFFYAEFNEIKSRSYTEAISPIIALIDEIEMIPIFNQSSFRFDLASIIQDNFLSILSLDRTKFGDRVVKIIAGLIMQQLLTLAEQHLFSEHIVFIIDEVAVVENPILERFLSEARKYNVSIILAGQYFGAISTSLQKSIFANVINYYIFRVSKDDAILLTQNLNIKVPLDDTDGRKVQILSTLQNRECVIRISSDGKLLPAIKTKTLDFLPIPRIQKMPTKSTHQKTQQKQINDSRSITLELESAPPLQQILQKTSTFNHVQKANLGKILRKKLARNNPIINKKGTE